MHSAKRIATNSLFYTGALVIQRVFSTLYFWFYSNNLPNGAHDLGRLQFVLSFVTLFFILGDLGLYLVFLRESSKQPQNANRYLNTLLTLKLPLILIAVGVVLVVAGLTQQANILLIFVALAWIVVDNISALIYALLRARQILIYESVSVVAVQLIVIAFGVTSIYLSGNILYLIVALLTGSVLNFCFVVTLLRKKYNFAIHFAYEKPIARMFVKYLPGFAIAAIVVKILNSIDVVLLQELSSDYEAVGFYSIPLKLINSLSLTVPTALMGALYPAFSHFFKESKQALSTVFQKSLEYLLILSVPMSVGFFALGDEFIQGLWKHEFLESVAPAKIMLLSLPFIFLAFPTGNLLNAIGKQKYTAVSRVIGALVLIALDTALILKSGLMGAAWALVITHVVIVVSDVYFLRDYIHPIKKALFNNFLKVALSSCIMYTAVLFLSPYIVWYALIVLGGIVYFSILFLCKGIDVEFLRHLKRL